MVVGLGMAGLVTLFCFDPNHYALYPRCVFHQVTGLWCPGCGGLRAVHQLLHGHIAAAFSLNPFFVLLLPVMLLYSARCVAGKMRNPSKPFTVSKGWLWVFLAAACVFGVWRNLPGVPFGALP
jgi:hypothetical protein